MRASEGLSKYVIHMFLFLRDLFCFLGWSDTCIDTCSQEKS